MKEKVNLILTYDFLGYTIHVCDGYRDGYYGSIEDADGKYVDCTPFRNDVESVKAAAETIVMGLKAFLSEDVEEQQRRDEKHGLYGGLEDIAN